MTTLIAILLLLFIPVGMVVLHLWRPGSKFLWLLAMLGALSAWVLVFLARSGIPYQLAPQTWQPETLFPLSPMLTVDIFSWVLALALLTVLLAVMLTSVARLSPQGFSPRSSPPAVENTEKSQPVLLPPAVGVGWRSWAAMLALTSLGLVAVLAGNLLTLLLAWAALDIVEGFVLLGQSSSREEHEQVVRSYSARVGGILVLLLAGIVIWNQGEQFTFGSSSPLVSLFLIGAAGLRLGILPMFVPALSEQPMRIGLGTMLRQVPAASSLILLVRSADLGIPGAAGLVVLGFTALAGLVGIAGWLRASNALAGRRYWMLASSALAMAAAIQGQPAACLAWSLVTLLPGSLFFLVSIRRRFLAVILFLGILCLSGLPFTPSWMGISLFQPDLSSADPIYQVIAVFLVLILFIVHVGLLLGSLVHALRVASPSAEEGTPAVERWVWLLYIPGLLTLPLMHVHFGFMFQPPPDRISLVFWIEGITALILAGVLWFYSSKPFLNAFTSRSDRQWLAGGKIYLPLLQLIKWFIRLLDQVIKVLSTVLEGEAGILWAFVLLVLGLVLLYGV